MILEPEIKTYIEYCHQLPELYSQIKKAEHDCYRIHGSGTFSETGMRGRRKTSSEYSLKALELIERKDDLIAEYRFMSKYCKRIEKRLSNLTDEELKLFYLRFEKCLTLRQIGERLYISKDAADMKIKKALVRI